MVSAKKPSGIKLLDIHGVSKNSNIQQEKKITKPIKGNKILQEKPRIGQERAGMRRRKPHINQAIAQSAEPLKKTPEVSKIEKKVINQPDFTTPVQSVSNPSVVVINRRLIQKTNKDIPFYPDPTYRPPPKLVKISTSESQENIDISLDLNIDFEENCSFQEGVISETYQRPDKSFFQ